MGELFTDRLSQASAANSSWLMVGLDPVLDRLPEGIARTADGVLEFNRRIVDATRDLVIGYKPNFAFYEVMGPDGWHALAETRRMIPDQLLALADAKRGDIGDTAEMYDRTIFDELAFDAATVTPYVGREGVQPFLSRKERGTFIVCRTSNRDGSLQDLPIDGNGKLFEATAEMAATWGDNVGLVVGATDLASLENLRGKFPHTTFLVPGVGAQGATAGDAIRVGANHAGANAIVSVSRSVIYASSGKDFAEAARMACLAVLSEMKSASPVGVA